MAENFASNYSYQIEKNDTHFFNKIVYHKNRWRWKSYMPVNSAKLKYFENKVYDMWWFTRWGCDYRTLSNFQSQAIACAKCFDIANDTNSNHKRIDISEINLLPNYTTNIILKDDNKDDNIPDYNFDSVSVNILPDNFSEVFITKNNDKTYDEYFVDLTEMWWKNYRLFRIQFYSGKNVDSRKAEIQVYWTCCRLESLYREFNWYHFLQRLLTWNCSDNDIKNHILYWLDTFYYTRYDFRIDFFIPDEDYKPLKATDIFNKKKDTEDYTIDDDKNASLTKKEYFNRKWIYTGWSAGIRSNKYIFCRQYHKKIDIVRNWDEELYADYHLYDGVIWRLEFEFWYRFLTSRWKIYITNWDDTLLNILINEYLWVSLQTWWFSKKYEKVPEIDFNLLDSNKRNRQLSYMATVWDRLYRSWYDVISTLLQAMSNKYHYDDKDINNILNKFKNHIDLPKNNTIEDIKSLDDILKNIDIWE